MESCKEINNALDKLGELEDIKEQWRLLILPKGILKKLEKNKRHNNYQSGYLDGYNDCIDEILNLEKEEY